MSAQNVLGLEDRNDTDIEQPDIEKTATLLNWGRGMRSFALTGLLLLACFYTLFFAEGFFAPLVLAVVFSFLLSPFVRALKKIWIPEAMGAGIVMLTVIFGLGVFRVRE